MLNKYADNQEISRNFTNFDLLVFKELHLSTLKNNPFHTDCKFTKRRVCRCNYFSSVLIDEKSQQEKEAMSRYLRVVYSGARDGDIKRSLQNVQELEDLYYFEPKFDGLVQQWKENENQIIREQIVQEQKNLIINGQCSYCQTTHSNKYYEVTPNPGETIVVCEDCAISNHPEIVTFNNKNAAVNQEALLEKKKKRMEAQAKRLQTLHAKKLARQATTTTTQESKASTKAVQEKQSSSKIEKEEEEDSDNSETQKECNWEKCKKKNKTDPEDILMCKGCHKSFHAECCDPPLEKAIVSKYDWFCTECKLCIVCWKNTKENELLMCDCCDRPFHMSCLDPARKDIPEGRWFCKDCEKCACCEALLFQNYSSELLKQYSQQQVDNKIICKDCWVYFKMKKNCPICFKIIKENEEGNFVNCDNCKLWLHYECEKKLSGRSFRDINRAKHFCCSKCRPIIASK